MNIITDFRPVIKVAHILRGQGVDPERARPETVAIAQEMLGKAQALLAPVALYDTLPVRDFRHRVILKSGASFEGPLVTRALAGATELALAVCTVGPALEERVTALLSAGDPVRALALDGAGTAAVGEIARMVNERVCDQASKRGLRIGMRVSPGQEGWPLEQQRVLFDLLPAEEIGIRLTESCLMLPRKSVSFAIGLGLEMRADETPCDFCSKRERCNWRAQKDEL